MRKGKVRAKDLKPHPNQMTDRKITEFFQAIFAGDFQPVEVEVQMAQVRANPFAPFLIHSYVQLLREDVEAGSLRPLYLAELPNGAFVDVDTPYLCEAYRLAGRPTAPAVIIGRLTERDCQRIGLQPEV